MTDSVVIVDYDGRWPALFEDEAARIRHALAGAAVAIEHIGSTAVPGLAAKPIVDIQVGVRRLPLGVAEITALERLGYAFLGESGVPGRLFFRKGDPRTHHVHVATVGSPLWIDHLLFRDYLRGHPGTAREYESLKRNLAREFGHDRAQYTDRKAPFIKTVLHAARAQRGA